MSHASVAGNDVILYMEHISKTFGSHRVLHDGSLEVRSGEIVGLLGQNGSGKSTLAKILAGYHAPDPGGRLLVGGEEIPLPIRPGRSHEIGLSFVHQDLGLIDGLSIQDNFYIGHYGHSFVRRIHPAAVRGATAKVLEEFGLAYDPGDLVSQLSPAEKSILAISRAVHELGSRHRGVLVLDEPTASLGRGEVAKVFSALHSVTSHGLGVIFVSHRIDEILSVTHRVTVLRDGHVVGQLNTDETSQAELVELIVGSRIATIYPAPSDKRDRNVRLSIEGLDGPGIGSVTFKARRGEIIGLTGLLGSGFSRLPAALNSRPGAFRGRVTIDGRTIDLAHDGIAARRNAGLAVVPADRHVKGAAMDLNVGENVSLPRISEFFRRGFLRSFYERQDVQEALQEFLVRPPRGELSMSRLSGGNQQKAVLAKWVKTDPLVLVLHEPTQGVDIGAKRDIFYLLKVLADKGTTLVLVSNEHEDLAHLCNRVLVFHGPCIAIDLSRPLSGQQILEACYAEHSPSSICTSGSADISQKNP